MSELLAQYEQSLSGHKARASEALNGYFDELVRDLLEQTELFKDERNHTL